MGLTAHRMTPSAPILEILWQGGRLCGVWHVTHFRYRCADVSNRRMFTHSKQQPFLKWKLLKLLEFSCCLMYSHMNMHTYGTGEQLHNKKLRYNGMNHLSSGPNVLGPFVQYIKRGFLLTHLGMVKLIWFIRNGNEIGFWVYGKRLKIFIYWNQFSHNFNFFRIEEKANERKRKNRQPDNEKGILKMVGMLQRRHKLR